MIPATTNFEAALANFLGRSGAPPDIKYLITIEGYSRAFTNFPSLPGIVQSGDSLADFGGAEEFPSTVMLPSGDEVTFSGANPGFIDFGNFELFCVEVCTAPLSSAIASGTGSTASITSGSVSVSFSLGGSHDWQLILVEIAAGIGVLFVHVDWGGATPSPIPGIVMAQGVASGVYFQGNLSAVIAAGTRTMLDFAWRNTSVGTPGPDPILTVTGATEVLNDDAVELWIGPGTDAPIRYPWLISPWPQDLTQTVNDLEGGADTSNLLFNVQDRGGAITGDFPSFVFEGALVTLQTLLPGLDVFGSDWCAIWTGFIDTVASDNNNLEYQFSCLDTTVKLAQVIYQTADDGGVTSSNHIKTLSANPMAILLDILQNQIVNADGSKGLPAALIDSTTITNYMNGPLAGLQFLFHLSSPPNAHDFIKAQIMKPLGGYLFVNALGQITVAFFYPLAGQTAAMTLGPGNWTSIPTAEQTDMVNTVEFQFDKDDADSAATGNYFSDVVQEYQPSIGKYGIYGEQVIQADGLRSAFLGFFIASFISWLYFFRYGFKNLKFDQYAAESLWQTMLLETGDVVAVTHPNIPDRTAGVMGITNKLFQILDKKWNLTEGLVTLTMIDASYLATFGFFEIAPNGEANYPSASAGDKGTYLFMSENGKYSTGAPANVLG